MAGQSSCYFWGEKKFLFFFCWLITWARTMYSQEPGTPCSSPTWVTGTQVLGPSSASSQAHDQGAELEVEHLITGMPVWDMGILGGNLFLCSTIRILSKTFLCQQLFLISSITIKMRNKKDDNCLLKYIYIHLFEREGEKCRFSDRGRSSIIFFILQMPTAAWAGPSQAQKLGTQSIT